MPTTDHIRELEERLAVATDDDRLDLMIELGRALLFRDLPRAHELAACVCNYARSTLAAVEKKEPKRVVASNAIIDARDRLARGLHLLGTCHRQRSEYPASLDSLHESLVLYEWLGNTERIGAVMIELGSTNYYLNDIEASLAYLNKGFELKKQAGDRHGAAIALGQLGTVHRVRGDFTEALKCYRQSMRAWIELDDRDSEARLRSNIGIIYHLSGNYTQALEEYRQSLEVFEELEDRDGITHVTNAMASLYMDLNDYAHSTELYLRSLKQMEEIGNVRGSTMVLCNLGEVSRRAGDLHQSIEHYRQSIEGSDVIGERSIRMSSTRGMAETLLKLDDTEGALNFAQASLQLCEALGNNEETARSLIVAGEVYTKMERFDSAAEVLAKALSIATSIDLKPILSNLHRALSNVYKCTGHYKKALDHYERFHAINAEIFNHESDLRVRTLMTSLDLERAEKEASLLRLSNRQLEQEIEFKKRELTATAMYLTQKNEFLRKLRRQIGDMKATKSMDKGLDDVLSEIDGAVDSQGYWQTFEKQFQQVHSEFLEQLTVRYPKLTPTEVKVCTLIKTGLSSKEIAEVLNTETRTVERYRNRIRKKLDLSQQDNLSIFLAAL